MLLLDGVLDVAPSTLYRSTYVIYGFDQDVKMALKDLLMTLICETFSKLDGMSGPQIWCPLNYHLRHHDT